MSNIVEKSNHPHGVGLVLIFILLGIISFLVYASFVYSNVDTNTGYRFW